MEASANDQMDDLLKSKVRKGDVHADHGDELRLMLVAPVCTLVIIDGASVGNSLGSGLDIRDKFGKVLSKLGRVLDLEEIQRFSLLGEASPLVDT